MAADILLFSKNVFTAKTDTPSPLYVAVKNGMIESVGPVSEKDAWIDADTQVFDLGDRVISPGFVDNHSFFTGHVLKTFGPDMSEAKDIKTAIDLLKEYADANPDAEIIFAHGMKLAEYFPEHPGPAPLDEVFKDRPVIVWADRRGAWMNTYAMDKYKFTPARLNAESYWRIMKSYLTADYIEEEFCKYMAMLNSRGITTTKEMGFDDYYGFTDKLEKLEKDNKLTLRVGFMSQPVALPSNIPYGLKMRDKFHSPMLFFDGFNQMVDLGFMNHGADLLEPYDDKPDTCCDLDIDYKGLGNEIIDADKYGFRFSVHTQGDAANRKMIDIFEKCQKVGGQLKNRHAITCMSLIQPEDLERMAKLGVTAEIYLQIKGLMPSAAAKSSVKFLGEARMENYANYRAIEDAGVKLAFASDLPLYLPDVTEGIFHAVGCLYNDSPVPVDPEKGLTVGELLKAYTINGQFDVHREDLVGTLEAGKWADITVLDGDVFTAPMDKVKDIKVCLTICNGKVVYKTI